MRLTFWALALAALAGCVSTAGPSKLPHGCASGTPYLACTKAYDDQQRALRDLREIRRILEANREDAQDASDWRMR